MMPYWLYIPIQIFVFILQGWWVFCWAKQHAVNHARKCMGMPELRATAKSKAFNVVNGVVTLAWFCYVVAHATKLA